MSQFKKAVTISLRLVSDRRRNWKSVQSIVEKKTGVRIHGQTLRSLQLSR